jgi:hypothetical protein
LDDDRVRLTELVLAGVQFLELGTSTAAVQRSAELLPIPVTTMNEFPNTVTQDATTLLLRRGLVPVEVIEALSKSASSEEKAALKFGS